MNFGTIIRLAIAVITLIVVAFSVINFVPALSNTAQEKISELSYYIPHTQESCDNFCYVSTNISNPKNTNILPLTYPCNFDILNIVTHVFELARWELMKLPFYVELTDAPLYVHTKDSPSIKVSDIPSSQLIKEKYNCIIVEENGEYYARCPIDYCILKKDAIARASEKCLMEGTSFYSTDFVDYFNIFPQDVKRCVGNIVGEVCADKYSFNRYAGMFVDGDSQKCSAKPIDGGKYILFRVNEDTFVDCGITCSDYSCQVDSKCLLGDSYIDCIGLYRSCKIDTSDCSVNGDKLICGGNVCKPIFSPGTCYIDCSGGGYNVYKLTEDYYVSGTNYPKLANAKLLRIYKQGGSVKGVVLYFEKPTMIWRGQHREYQQAYDDNLILKLNQSIEGAITNPYYFENATYMLFKCLAYGICDDDLSYYYFCKKDKYLLSYPYVNCFDKTTLKQKLTGFSFYNREGKDLETFSCRGNTTYDLCLSNYYNENCWPPWAVLREKRGRCEDFAILAYTLFRAMGITEDENSQIYISLKMGQCTLPCACKLLFDKCGFNYSLDVCSSPQYVSVYPFGTFDACHYSDINGSIFNVEVGSQIFKISQNFTGKNSFPVYLHKSFEGKGKYYETPYGYSSGICDKYKPINLLDECSVYVNDPDEFKKAVGDNCDIPEIS